ncbi:hypothetical protein CEUSTIGMA_g4047.t1 [Chlamydomonas eustigma]|uniref:Hflx-type G domain-containing protein n=1 Tax=Chlamydomonas eustigma TaxID=1157962 RepID=A0A250X0J6_9CHLO|nr:hypothetical protein CEUSTIGMA_g4047.t1 [Chlamydomonas eustigma]|eukprot:GAX76601.1 hypothetical protein CEUSTIGMA_g4047.t1 [Chlamydomonas eustigma]
MLKLNHTSVSLSNPRPHVTNRTSFPRYTLVKNSFSSSSQSSSGDVTYEPAPPELFQLSDREIVEYNDIQKVSLTEGIHATESAEDVSSSTEYRNQYSCQGAQDPDDGKERVYLVGASLKSEGAAGRNGEGSSYGIEESLEELGRLADTAGLKVVGSTYQVLSIPNNATYIGSGKVSEVSRAVRALDVETVIFDDELSPGQLRNLEKAVNGGDEVRAPVKVCDRTALILDIFSQRAQTREGKLQVELAQTEYQLPRLTRMWTHLDRVGGGGQVKGTGEKQIETDKRLLRERASQLKRELESVRTHRRNYRVRRSLTPVPVVAIVGYTNAGKSTLLNTLTEAGVLAEDKLFATLDPTTRKVRLKGNKEVLMSDTVGFIQKLPTELVAAFRATLEEIQDAQVILHVVDISHPHAQAQSEAVNKVLADLDVEHIPLVTAWNKVDQCPDPAQVKAVAAIRPDPTVCISGLTGEGLPDLMSMIASSVTSGMEEVEVLLPYPQGDLLEQLHVTGQVLSSEFKEEGVLVCAMVPPSVAGRVQQYSLRPVAEKNKRIKKRVSSWEDQELLEEHDELTLLHKSDQQLNVLSSLNNTQSLASMLPQQLDVVAVAAASQLI